MSTFAQNTTVTSDRGGMRHRADAATVTQTKPWSIMYMSTGAFRVGTGFNPSSLSAVDQVKHKTAELIDLILAEGVDRRTAALAATAYEEAAMWAVKSLTKPHNEGAPNG